MTATMYDDYLKTLLRIQIAVAPTVEVVESQPQQKMSYSSPEATLNETSVSASVKADAQMKAQGAAKPPEPSQGKPQTFVKDKDDIFANVGRNDPCPCGSGKKFKKCHGA